MKPYRATCIALLMLATSGCVETRFESPPGDNIETCDVRWKGLWIGDDEKPKDSVTAFAVDDGCRFSVLDQAEKGGPFKEIRVPVNFVHADGKDYLIVVDNALKGLLNIKPVFGVDPPPEKSFYFVRYQARADRIDLYQVDDKLVARQIIEHKLRGTVSATDNELHVFVQGNRAQTLEILQHGAIFNDKSDLHLVRVKQSVPEYERSLIAAQRKKSP